MQPENKSRCFRSIAPGRGKPVRSCAGFTLIELLVVVAIISLLVSILLPSLATAKALAKSVVCQSNLKQILNGSTLYSEDYAGYIVPVYSPRDGWPDSLYNWTGLLLPYLGGGNVTAFSSSGDLPVASCPESPLRFGYGHNYYLGIHYEPNNTVEFYRLDEVKTPSSTVHFVDNIDARPGKDPSLFMYWKPFVRPGGCSLVDVPPYFIHPGEKANVAWLDTHVDARIEDVFWEPYNYDCFKEFWDRN